MANRTHRSYAVVRRLVSLALLVGAASGCAFKGKVPRTHVVMAHSRGWAVEPANGYRRLSAEEYDAHIDASFADMEEFCRTRTPCQILFFVHGGMNTRTGTLERVEEMFDRIKKADVYPVYLNWHSSFPSSWWDHLAKVRKGLWLGGAWPLAPYIFLSDEIRAVPEAPSAWAAEGRHAFTTMGPGNPAVAAYNNLVRSPNGLKVNDLTTPAGTVQDDRNWMEKHQAKIFLPVTAPVKIVAAPFVVQPWGIGAWDIMLRRTTMLFRTEEAFSTTPGPKDPSDIGAAFAHFLQRFQSDFIPRMCAGVKAASAPTDAATKLNTREAPAPPSDCANRIALTFVGHSMGAIIVNEALRQVPRLDVRNIVYMASASSVRDYRDTVLPYLREHRTTEMFHLVLHPQAEVKERGFLDLSPRGSLLVWIDNYFSNPIAPVDRTAGRFFNLTQELRFTDEEVKSRVHLKVFRAGQGVRCWNPQKHGDFGNFPYWDRRFWDPAVSTSAGTGAPARWRDQACDEAKGVEKTIQ